MFFFDQYFSRDLDQYFFSDQVRKPDFHFHQTQKISNSFPHQEQDQSILIAHSEIFEADSMH